MRQLSSETIRHAIYKTSDPDADNLSFSKALTTAVLIGVTVS